MAAATTTTAVTVLLLLFTFSSALNRPKNVYPSLVTLPDSDPKMGAAILLPSERTESEPATMAEIDPAETQSAGSKSQETEQYEVKTESVSESESETDSLPLTTVVTLRPINRHFSRGPFFPIRRGHKCHGHRRQHNLHFHQLRQRFGGQGFNGQREISYGNDMIIGAKDQDRGFDRAFSGEGRRWSRYNHGGQRLSLTNNEMEEMNGMVHPHIYHHHRQYRHHYADDGEEEEKHRHENGIIKGIMKFLNL